MDGDGAAPRGDRGAPDIQRVVRAPAHPYFGPPSNPYFGPPSNPYFGPPSNPYHVPCASLYREPAEGAGESLLPHPPEGGLVLLGGVPDGCCVSWDNLGVRVSSPRGGGAGADRRRAAVGTRDRVHLLAARVRGSGAAGAGPPTARGASWAASLPQRGGGARPVSTGGGTRRACLVWPAGRAARARRRPSVCCAAPGLTPGAGAGKPPPPPPLSY